MIINDIVGNKHDIPLDGLEIDYLELEWFETSKRIQSKVTNNGTKIAIKFLKEGQRLSQDDILFIDNKKAIVINIRECEAIVVAPTSLLEMGTVCYEIGNKHAPIFIQSNQVLIPFEEPLFRWLATNGYRPIKEMRQLKNMLKSADAGHAHSHKHSDESLSMKIISSVSKLTNEE